MGVYGFLWMLFRSDPPINYIEAAPDDEKLSNRISAYVTVFGEDERLVTDLSLEDFTALEDGRPIQLDSVSDF